MKLKASSPKVTEPQIRRLWAIADKNNIYIDNVYEILETEFKKENLEDLTMDEYGQFVERLER